MQACPKTFEQYYRDYIYSDILNFFMITGNTMTINLSTGKESINVSSWITIKHMKEVV